MKIITEKQAVLELILSYWDKPSPTSLTETIEKIRVHWPRSFEYSYLLDWDFVVSPESIVYISLKYLHKQIILTKDRHVLIVDSNNLKMQIYFNETDDECFKRYLRRIILT